MCHYCWDRGAIPHIVEAEKFLGWGEGEGFRTRRDLWKLSIPEFAEMDLSW